MGGKMINLHRLRILYAVLIQIEYVLALITGVTLGYENWLMFSICLVLCLLLGLGTTALYWTIFDRGVK